MPPALGKRAAIGAAVLAVVAIVVSDPVQRFDEFKTVPQGTEVTAGSGLLRSGSSGRWQFWNTAVDGYASAPVGGLGAGGYAPYWIEHREIALPATRAHSLLLETLAELGIVGLALVVAFFAVPALAATGRLREPGRVAELAPALGVLAVGFAVASVDWIWDLPGVFVATVIAAALLSGPATLPPGPRGGPGVVQGTVRSRRRFSGGVAVLIGAWVAICACGLLLLANHSVDAGRDQLGRGRVDDAVSSANNAIDLEPWAAEPRELLALAEERAGDIPAARRAVDEAIERRRGRLPALAAALAARRAGRRRERRAQQPPARPPAQSARPRDPEPAGGERTRARRSVQRLDRRLERQPLVEPGVAFGGRVERRVDLLERTGDVEQEPVVNVHELVEIEVARLRVERSAVADRVVVGRREDAHRVV